MPDDRNLRYRTGTYVSGPDETRWGLGDRGIRCFVWFSDNRLTKSVKDGGAKALPVG